MYLRLLTFCCFILFAVSGFTGTPHYSSIPDKKVEVELRMYLADIFNIDDSKKSAFVKFFVSTKWKDRRLVGKYKKPTTIPIGQIWYPRIEMMSRKNLVANANQVVTVNKDGVVSRLVRYTGSISFKANYADYPFDNQKLVFNFITPDQGVTLKMAKYKGLRARSFGLEGWVFGEGTFTAEEFDLGGHVAVYFKGLSMKIHGQRNSKFYLWKIFYPLTIILLIAGSIFGIDPSQVAARISVTTISTLTLVAYDFIIASLVPTLSYLTKIDIFYFSALSLVFYAFSGSVFTSYVGRKNIGRAVKISHGLGILYITFILILYIIVLN